MNSKETQCNLLLIDNLQNKNDSAEKVSENSRRDDKRHVRSRGTQVNATVFESRATQCEGSLSEIFKGKCIERTVHIVQSTEEFKNLNVQVRKFLTIYTVRTPSQEYKINIIMMKWQHFSNNHFLKSECRPLYYILKCK